MARPQRGGDTDTKYDVFLSFRGPDVRKGFVGHLYEALTRAGFRVFLDSHAINKGEEISAALHNAIEESAILIPIFSHHFAQSAWCLDEASLIARQVVLERQGKGSSITIPLFYYVTPSQVRNPDQDGSPFAEAFVEHERSGKRSLQKTNEWKTALSTICELVGWSIQQDTNESEAELVKDVVEDVDGKLRRRRTLQIFTLAEFVKRVVEEVGKLCSRWTGRL